MLGISYREHKTNEYIWQQVSIAAGPQELLLSTVKHHKLSWFGVSVAMIRCWRSCCRAPWTEVVPEVDRISRERTTSRNGRTSRCHHCYALQRTGVDGRPSQRRHLSVFPNDAWASRVLLDWLINWFVRNAIPIIIISAIYYSVFEVKSLKRFQCLTLVGQILFKYSKVLWKTHILILYGPASDFRRTV